MLYTCVCMMYILWYFIPFTSSFKYAYFHHIFMKVNSIRNIKNIINITGDYKSALSKFSTKRFHKLIEWIHFRYFIT